MTAGSRGIFDIDSGGLDTLINLLDSNGNLVEWSDDSLSSTGRAAASSGGFGSTLDLFLDYTSRVRRDVLSAVGLYNNGNTTPANIRPAGLSAAGFAHRWDHGAGPVDARRRRHECRRAERTRRHPGVVAGRFSGNGGHDNVSDIDPGAVTGIALTTRARTAPGGSRSTMGRPGTASVRSTTRMLVAAGRRAPLLPARCRLHRRDTTPRFRAWDLAGAAGDKADASTNGGITPFSAATQPADIAVVNHAPVFTAQFENFADQFASQSYGLSSGSVTWPGSWSETGEPSTSPAAGEIQVVSDGAPGNFSLRFSDTDGSNDSIQRAVNLTGADTAILSFDYRRQGLDDANDEIRIAVSTDGTNFSDIAVIEGPTNDSAYQSFSIDISSFISATTSIRILAPGALGAMTSSTPTTSGWRIRCHTRSARSTRFRRTERRGRHPGVRPGRSAGNGAATMSPTRIRGGHRHRGDRRELRHAVVLAR